MLLDIINIILIVYIIIFLFKKYYYDINKILKLNCHNNKIENEEDIENNANISDDLQYRIKQRDIGVIKSEIEPPERRYDNYGTVLKLNERTRGDQDNYQLVGLLYNNQNNVDKVYQLYGRREYQGSDQWEYYIRGMDKGGLDYKYPLKNTREIRDGEVLTLDIDKETYTVKIYDYAEFKYIPYV